jgi:hypothetical protein
MDTTDGPSAGPSTPAHHPATIQSGPSRSRATSRTASPSITLPQSPSRPSTPHLDLTSYPTTDLLRLLANLLQQIATANDHLRPQPDSDPNSTVEPDTDPPPTTHYSDTESNSNSTRSSNHLQPHPSPTTALFQNEPHPSPSPTAQPPHHLFSASKTSLSHPSSLLSFHARHIPSISIESYLLRILKYCPTTNEVFLGLLVYFDRMSRLGTSQGVGGVGMGVEGREGLGGGKEGMGVRGFAIDSYNVHRLVIAGVTVASKFFSGAYTLSPM